LVRENDYSFSVATFFSHGHGGAPDKRGSIYVPFTKKRYTFKTYNAWIKNCRKYFTILNETISW